MPAFPTPDPITVLLELGVADVRIAASERTDTVVEVRPTNPAEDSDLKAAQQTRVEFAEGTLRVTAPRFRALDFSRSSRSIDLFIELPAGSRLDADVQAGDVRSSGTLGDCRVKTGVRDVRLGDTGGLRVETGAGHVAVGRVSGSAEIKTGTGRVSVEEVDGSANVKNSNGVTEIRAVGGDLRVRSANGDILIGQAAAGIDAKTSCGTIQVGEVVRGTVELKTGYGDLEVGIAEGTAAWLDVHTGFGHLRNTLSEAGADHVPAGEQAAIKASTSFGDITIRRSERQLP